MKTSNIKYAVILICGVMAACGIFNSCKLDEPEPTPQEELFLREFIKKYGLIDPNQDWNQAVQAKVTIRVAYAKEINLFVKVADMYYRVASYAEVYDEVVIPVDIPEGTDKIFVDIDDRFFTTTPGGVVDATRTKAPSRATINDIDTGQNWNNKPNIIIPTTAYIDCTYYFYYGDTFEGSTRIQNTTKVSAAGDIYHFNLTQGDKVYAQLHNSNEHKSEMSFYVLTFTTETTGGATLYVNLRNILSETITLGSGTQTHSYKMHVTGNAFRVLCFFAESGNVKIGNIEVTEFRTTEMAWLLVAEDLGATDDFDFNDVIVRIEAVNVNAPKLAISLDNKWWQVVEDDEEHMVLGPSSAPSRAGSRAAAYTTLRISAMCAGGTLDSYLHFATGSKDFVLGPNSEPLDLTTATPPTTDYTEWHSWFTGTFSEGDVNSRDMLNTGLNDATGLSAEIVVPSNFSMTNYSVLYKDYDGDPDDFDSGKYNHNNGTKTDNWVYDINPTVTPNDLIQGFYITVGEPTKEDCNTILTAPIAGRAPQMFLIPDVGSAGYWKWPRERVPITNVYPRFSKWVHGTDADWYLDTPPTTAQTHEDRTVTPPVISLVRN